MKPLKQKFGKFLLSKEKLAPRIEMCKQSLITKTQGAKVRGEPTIIGMAELKLICYATRTTAR